MIWSMLLNPAPNKMVPFIHASNVLLSAVNSQKYFAHLPRSIIFRRCFGCFLNGVHKRIRYHLGIVVIAYAQYFKFSTHSLSPQWGHHRDEPITFSSDPPRSWCIRAALSEEHIFTIATSQGLLDIDVLVVAVDELQSEYCFVKSQ